MAKYLRGDIVNWLGKRRVVAAIERTKHGGHCYYGLRILRSVAHALPTLHQINIGRDGKRGRAHTYLKWVRSDRLHAANAIAARDGTPGRPTLHATRGRPRTLRPTQTKPCPYCPTQINLTSQTCRACRWHRSPRLRCPSCKGRKRSVSQVCQKCDAKSRISPRTAQIIERLKTTGRTRGIIAQTARDYDVTTSFVSQIIKRFEIWPLINSTPEPHELEPLEESALA
jgi:hypothetical protein